ncbi:SusC/RagA family TonB-linked outer membrane protein [Chryseolinea lacunae]|uniref:SusC/RagA family TonB-linked outer membrane protein n=1 Tax=Chryseolinea lacunae TaxID=2801331 RepID=A0ABS1KVG7_9BACT|nr:SusC/RagA family TonB-linked outer membrane protein [Chryseolinea lacunae]MBL0743359.1 SusC/RagA family TonB-linked outer membrane protein [Chryseolinea lacunae]
MKKFLLTCFALAIALYSFAQGLAVTGKVSSAEDGSAMPGVNVVVKGTTNGTVTDTEGNYKLTNVSGDANLVFSFIGLLTQETNVGGRTTIDIQMKADVQQLSEVVVTAQGVEREQKALGYAQTTISSAALANKPETDIGRALQGRTPGLQIMNSSGLAGSGTRINIRGNSSITGNTQPLWVVNGVPINTDANDINGDFRDGQVAPTRFLDIDPNNIESISVLRGLSATTLYGSQGRNGVILVTTKTGSTKGLNKFEGSVSQSYFVVEAHIPEFQNKWANGFDGAYGEFFSNWGSLFNGKPTGVNHPYYEWRDVFPDHPEFAQSGSTNGGYVPTAAPNNVKDFFRKGSSATTSLNLGTKTDFGSVSFSYSHLAESGFVQYNDLKRDNFGLGINANLTKKLSLSSTFNYVRTDFKTPPSGAGQGSSSVGGPSIFSDIFYVPRNIDLSAWPWENPADHSNVYYRNNKSISNPYWVLNNSRQTNLTSRFFSSSTLKYQITDWLSAAYRLGYDTYSERQTYYVNKGGATSYDANLIPGAYRTTAGLSTVVDHSAMLTMNKELSESLSLTGIVGYNYRKNTYVQEGLESLGQVVYGLIEHRNFTSTQPRDFRGTNLNRQENSAIAGAYFDFALGYKEYLYFNVSGRNDWSSNLQKATRSKFYPGVSVSFVPTAAFPSMASETLDFLKFRVAYGSSANFGTPYRTVPYLMINAQNRVDGVGNVVTTRLSNILANANLQPELLTETEVGAETNLFDNRIKLNASYYHRSAKDQIIQRPLDPATGYTSTFINAGTIVNKGWEISLTLTPLRTTDWTWDITANWTKNKSIVESLPEGSKEINTNGFSNLGNFAIEGQPLNVIKGSFTEKTPDGQLIVAESGSYKIGNEIAIIGDPNPNWQGSIISTLTFKGIALGMQWDYVQGGQVFSYTSQTMVGRGVSKDLEDFDPSLPLILPGVREVTDADGNVTGYKPNDIPLTTAGVFFGNTIIGEGANDRGIYDATRIRFREISLSYSIPKSLISRFKLTGVNISFVGNNLWYRAFNTPKYAKADLDRTAFGTNNGAGFDFLGGPSAKRYGVNLKISF